MTMSDGTPLNGGAHPEPVPLGIALNLGVAFQPAPCAYSFVKLQPVPALYLLRVEHATGETGIVLNEADFRTFIAKAQEVLTGIVLPS